MKNVTQTPSRRLLQALTMRGSLIAAILLVAGIVTTASAQTSTITKANSSTSLTTPSDWVGSIVPGTTNIAVWNSTVTGADTEGLGANTNWAGIQILNPGGPVTISNDGFTNTLGTVGLVGLNGVDMSSATASLTINDALALNGVQNWIIASGQSLTLGGNLIRNEGGVARMYFTPGSATVTVTNGSAAVNNVDTTPNALLGSSYGNNLFAILNDTDFVAEVTSGSVFQLVPGATISGLYTLNPSGATPSDAGNETMADQENTNSYGIRLGNTRSYGALRFNTQQGSANYIFNGVDAWDVNIPSGRTLTTGAILVTTNVGTSPVLINNGANSGGTTGFLRIGNGGGQDLLIYQDNPGAPLIIQPNVSISQQGAAGVLVKMGVGTLQIQDGAAYTGGTKIYEGTIELDGAGTLDTGVVNVYGGNLAQSSATVNGAPVTFYSGANNNILVTAANGQTTDNTNVTFNGNNLIQFVYSNSLSPSATIAALNLTNVNGLTLNGPINVNVASASLALGQFPLIKYAGTVGGAGFSAFNALILPPHIYGYLSNNAANSSFDLVVTNVDQPLVWNVGNPGGTWDVNVSANWLDANSVASTYQQVGTLGDNVLFNDNATPTGAIAVTLNTNITPSSVTFNNAANTYTVSGSGGINGLGVLSENGSGTLTLATTNSFSGGINLNGGTTIFSTIKNLGSGNINFNGGTLQYNGNTDDLSTRTVTIGSGGATINTAGSSVLYGLPIGTGGAGGLTKTGAGTLTLTGNNTYSGNTVISQGTLALSTNTDLTNSAAIVVNGSTILDAATSGINLALSTPVNQILAGTGQVNGTVTVSPSTTISPATNGVIGTLAVNGGLVVNGGTLAMDVGSSSHDLISVTGNLTLNSGTVVINATGILPLGRYILVTYTASLAGNAANLTPSGFNQAGAIGTLDTSVANQLALVVGVAANDNLVWAGVGPNWDTVGDLNWSNGPSLWAYTNGDNVTFNDSAPAFTTVNLVSPVVPSTVLVSNTVSTYAFGNSGGSIQGGTNTSLIKDGSNALIMDTANTYQGTTSIKNGTLQIGNGAAGDIGRGNITNNGALIFAEGDGGTHPVYGPISGTGSLTVNATNSIVVLRTNNTYAGPTVIGAGTLQVGNGTAAGSLGSNTSVTDNGALTLNFTTSTTFADNISGSGSFGTVGSGVITLSGSLTYQGSTGVSNGTVKINSNNQLPNANSVAGSTGSLNVDGGLNGPSVLDMNGFNVTANGLSGAANTFVGVITNGSATTTTTNTLTILNVASATNTFNGRINDHGSTGAKTAVFVTGQAGTLVLNPPTNNLFSAGLTVSNSTVWIGAPGSATTANIFESTEAVGTGLITLLGTNTSLYLNGGQPGASTTPTYNPETNALSVPAGAYVTIWACNRGDYGGPLTGSGTIDWVDQYVRGGVNGNWSAFTGQIIMQGNNNFSPGNVGNVGFGATNGLPNATVTMITNVDFHAGSLSGSTPANWPTNAAGVPNPFPIGALQGGDDTCELQGTSSGNAEGVNLVFAIGGLNTSTAYGGGIVDPVGILKVGTGTLTLDDGGVFVTNIVTGSTGFGTATNIGYQALVMSYTGTTTVSNGVLKLDVPVNITNSSIVTIAATNAELDASSMGTTTNEVGVDINDNAVTNEVLLTNSIFEVITNQTLVGVGTLNGFLQADQYSTFNVGLRTGTFNVTSNATLAGAVNVGIDVADSPNNGELAAPSFTISNTATLVVTNIGPALTNGVTFTLFNHPVSFTSVTLPATDPTATTNYMWQNNLSVNGSITLTNGGLVIVPVNPNPTNIVFSATANPGSITLSWPSDHTGWTLQSQTNGPGVGLTAIWYNVAGSTGTDQIVVPFIPTDSVFYRMVYTNTP